MSRKEATSWVVYWIGIAFILTCLTQALLEGSAAADDDSGCGDDPICIPKDWPAEELQRCETVCHTDSMGRVHCTTKCYDRTGRRI